MISKLAFTVGLASYAYAQETYACNPAHSYPAGEVCTSIDGVGLTLVTPSPTAEATYACNPAHSYPGGVSCISTDGTLSLYAPSATADAAATDCYAKYNACRVQPQANMASCAADYAACLGYNPFASNGTNTVTPAYNPADYVTTTQVVTALTTYCPSATTLTFNNKTYAISTATTLTVTDCPCTVTTSYPAAKPTANATVPAQPPVYTGPAANGVGMLKVASGAFAATAVFAMAFLL